MWKGWKAILGQRCQELALEFPITAKEFWNSLENSQDLGIACLQFSRCQGMELLKILPKALKIVTSLSTEAF